MGWEGCAMFFLKLGSMALAFVVVLATWSLAAEEETPTSGILQMEVKDAMAVLPGGIELLAGEADLSGFGTVIRNSTGKGEITHGLDPRLPLGERLIEMDYPINQLGLYAAGSFWATCFGLASEYRRPFHQILECPDENGKIRKMMMTVSQANYIDADDRYVMEYSTVMMPNGWSAGKAREFSGAYRKVFEQVYCQDMTLVAVTTDKQEAWTGFTLVCQDYRGRVAIMKVTGLLIEYIFVADSKLTEWLCNGAAGCAVAPNPDTGLGLLLLPRKK